MEKLISYLEENNYKYEIEYNGILRLYEVVIKKGNKGIIRHYPYGIENMVSIRDMIGGRWSE